MNKLTTTAFCLLLGLLVSCASGPTGPTGPTGPRVFQTTLGRHVGYHNAAGQWEGEGSYTITAPGPNFSDRFVGNFSNGKRQGQGRYTFFGGNTQNGLWINDQLFEANDIPSIVSTEIEEMDRQARDLRLRRLREEASEEQRVANQQVVERQVLQNQCRSFGFTDNTPEMANCLLELYKIENQPQQNTVITSPAPATNNSQDLYQSLELLNRGLQILNGVGTPSAPSSRTSRCRLIGDTSGQVYTFSRIGCPIGYAPAL
jgi:hypothetical protein